MQLGAENHPTVRDRLLRFKDSIRTALLSNKNHLPMRSIIKVFNFTTIRYEFKGHQNMILTLKSIALVTRLLEIVQISLDLIAKDQIITKRNLYYKLVNYYQNNYSQIDSDLDLLCFNAAVTKEELKIFSSSRCLLFGRVVLLHNNNQIVCSPDSIFNVSLAEKMKDVRTVCRRLVIVEKQSAMYQLHQEMSKIIDNGNQFVRKIREDSIFLSGKGYPDTTSRNIVEILVPLVDEIYYLGDSDIYGADILLSYSIGFNSWSTFVPKVRWIQLSRIIEKHRQPEIQVQTKEDKLKYIQVMKRPYLEDINYFIPAREDQAKFKEKMLKWKAVIHQMQQSKYKVELQSFFSQMPAEWIEQMFQSDNSV